MGRTRKLQAGLAQRDFSLFVGEYGHLFYDNDTGSIRRSDGQTPGGVAISVNTNVVTTESILPDVDNVHGIGTPELRWNHIHLGDGGVYFDGVYSTPQTVPYIPNALTGSLVPAVDNNVNLGSTSTRFANLYLGYQGLFLADQTTDANVNITVNSGTLYVAGAANLAIGNLVIEDTTLKSANSTLDISIGDAADTGFFYVKRKAQFNNISFSGTEPMVSFNAAGGIEPLTIFPDTVLQTVGRPNKNSRIIQRAYGSTSESGGNSSYAVWGSYAARGTVAAPQALKQNDILARVSANGYGTSTWTAGGARIEFIALENFTDTAKGTRINFWTTPAGQVASQNVASINSVGMVTSGVEFSATGRVQTDAGIPITAKAVSSATYVATLGVDGKLDSSQIPTSLSGALVYKGGWDANANSPSLSNGVGTDGWEYSITITGTRSLGTQTGTLTYEAGGFIIYGAGIWNYTPPFSNFTYATAAVGSHIRINNNQGTQETGVIGISLDATPTASTSTIVSRDGSGNFAANMITANLTGVVTGSVSGNAGSVSNGVYTIGDQTIGGTKTFASVIQGTITSATLAASVVGGIGVASLTAGTGTVVSASSGAVTVWINTATLVANAVSATTASFATTSGFAISFNTSTLVANAVSATTASFATTSGFAQSFNTSTLVANAVSATTSSRATTATNLSVATSILAGTLSAATGNIGKNSIATVTYTITGLTTSHKIIITPGTDMPDRQFAVTAAYASALNTVSIQYANNSGGAISVTLNINYFAFV